MQPWLLLVVFATGPMEPQASLQAIACDPAVKISLVAHEPQIVDPVSARFDEQGRLWVVEMRDYPTGPVGESGPQGTVKILRDKDGDGFFETSHTFISGLWFPTGVQPWQGGVIVTMAGSVEFMRDNDGDDQCDQREVWFEGFAADNTQLRANHPTLSPDGRLYIANGLRSGQIVSKASAWPSREAPVPLAGRDFVFQPHGGFYGAETGGGQFGMSIDDYGNRVICSNRNPCDLVALPVSVIERDSTITAPKALYNMAKTGTDSALFPLVQAWTTSNLHSGQFTAACGVHWYHGNALPQEYYRNIFVCDPTGSLVQRQSVSPQSTVWDARRVPNEQEFIASRDPWFRAVDLTSGPDGALYVVDMYRAVIEHPDFVPVELKQRPDERLGNDRGRIYRVTARESSSSKHNQVEWQSLTIDQAIELLSHTNAWHRETASRWLWERIATSSTPTVQWQLSSHAEQIVTSLKNLLNDQKGSAEGRARCIALLAPMNAFDKPSIASSLNDRDPLVVSTALMYCDSQNIDLSALANDVPRLNGPAKRMLAVLVGGGETKDSQSIEAAVKLLASLAREPSQDPVMQTALGAVATPWCAPFLKELQTTTPVSECAELKQHLAYRIGQSSEPSQIWTTLESKGDSQVALMNRWAQGVIASRRSIASTLAGDQATHEAAWKRWLAEAHRAAEDQHASVMERSEAVQLLKHETDSSGLDALWALWKSAQEPQLRVALIETLASRQHPKLYQDLLEHLMEFSPELRRRAVDLMIGSPRGSAALLEAMELKSIPRGAVDLVQSQRLTKSSRPEIADRAAKLLASSAGNRQAVIDRYKPICQMPGNAKRGEQVFRTACANCHRIGDIGIALGPDISDSRTKNIDQILQAILDPDAAIDASFVRYTLLTADGRVVDGLLVDESVDRVTIRPIEGPAIQIPRSDVESLKSAGVSLMPTGFETTITPAAMRDLIAYIKQWRYLEGSVPADVNSIK